MARPQSTVHIVDDDTMARKALAFLIESADWQVKIYASARQFLDEYKPSQPECLVLDVRMPEMNGLGLQQVLLTRRIFMPVIIVTGHGDMSVAVRGMRAGAVDVIEKPFTDHVLLDRIEQCFVQATESQQEHVRREEVRARLKLLTQREREVMDLLLVGKRTKEVATELSLSVRTVEGHRARIMRKLDAKSLSDVVRISLIAK